MINKFLYENVKKLYGVSFFHFINNSKCINSLLDL